MCTKPRSAAVILPLLAIFSSAWGEGIDATIADAKLSFSAPGVTYTGGTPDALLLEGEKEIPCTLRPQGEPVLTTGAKETPMGKAATQTFRWTDKRGYTLTWTMSKLETQPGFTLQTTFENGSAKPVRLRELGIARTQEKIAFAGQPADWWFSSRSLWDQSRSIFDPGRSLQHNGKSWFLDTLHMYADHSRTGLVMGAVGPAESDVRFRLVVEEGRARLDIASEMTDVLVPPGQSRRSEEVLVLARPYREAMVALFRWIAATHGARTSKGPLYGWCSWYDRAAKITAKDVSAFCDAVAKEKDRLPMQLIQIDDGWQRTFGDWRYNEKFPQGLAPLCEKIRAVGATPGVWFAGLNLRDCEFIRNNPDALLRGATGQPFKLSLDPTHPKTQELWRQTIRQLKKEGIRYFKVDFNGLSKDCRLFDSSKTRFQGFREEWRILREEIGEDCYLMGCNGGIQRGAIGYVDAQRIGTDSCAEWGKLYDGCKIGTCVSELGLSALGNGILWANDPDVTYTLPRGPLTADELKTWHSLVGLLGGMMLVSEPFDNPKYLTDESIRRMEIITPPAPDKGWSFNGGCDPWHRQFGFVAQRPEGNFASVLLWNPGKSDLDLSVKAPGSKHASLVNPEKIPQDIAMAGVPLEPLGKTFHAWSFWDEKYMGVIDGTFVARQVPPHAPVLLRLTALPKADEPVLVGSNLHISMGSAEVKETIAAPEGITIVLRGDAGARAGKLFIFSKRPLSLAKADGCEATLAPGEPNIYIVSVAKRQRGTTNTIRLAAK